MGLKRIKRGPFLGVWSFLKISLISPILDHKEQNCLPHASALTAAAKFQPIEFQNQWAVPIISLAFLPVDGRPHPVSVSMVCPPPLIL